MPSSVGSKLRFFRKRKSLTSFDVAVKLGIPIKQFKAIEHGFKPAGLKNLIKMLDLYTESKQDFEHALIEMVELLRLEFDKPLNSKREENKNDS